MTLTGWGIVLVAILVAAYLFWRWRQAENQLLDFRQRTLLAREDAAAAKKASTSLQSYLDAIAGVSAHGIFLIDVKRTVLWVNENACQLCVDDVTPPVPLSNAIQSYEVLELVDLALADDQPHERQFVRDDSTFHARALRMQAEPHLVALTVEDVTELQRLGRARRDFVANISHDLRTPIAAIQVMAETLLTSTKVTAKKQEQLLIGITDQTATLQQLSQELLDLSLIESGRMPLRLVETEVEELIEPVIQGISTQAEHQEIVIRTDYDPALKVLADAESVRRVLQNILHNAIKFTETGGEVGVGAEAAGEDVRFWVSDTGPGIAPEDTDRIFERFYKGDRMRSGGGTGLGLAIARHIVEGHGGKIWVESAQGHGATFYFTLLRG